MGTRTVAEQRREAAPARRELRGVVERITYQNPENGYTVARLAPERAADAGNEAEAARGDDRLVTLVGTLADLTPGEAIVAHSSFRSTTAGDRRRRYLPATDATLDGAERTPAASTATIR